VLAADVEVDRREFTVRAAVQVAPGERLALFGPSGAGKTTVLEAIAGLVRPRRGRVELGGRVLSSSGPPQVFLPPWRRRVGLLRQDPGIFPHLSVHGNLAYAPRDRSGAELAQVTEALGISALVSAMPSRLSGGQAHRVALGRLLLAHCDALLLDEPYTGLDAGLRRSLTELVAGIVAERSVPAVLVAHELTEAQAFADTLALIDEGVMLQAGPPDEVVRRPASRRAAELVGYLGFVPAPGGPGAAGLPGTIIGVHPERVVAGVQPRRGVIVSGYVTAGRPAGAGWEADLAVGAETVTCRLPERPPQPGSPLDVTVIDPPWFGRDGTATAPPLPFPESGHA
jgi:ABC-type sulfate/molybdate transport systems ATPase subunit